MDHLNFSNWVDGFFTQNIDDHEYNNSNILHRLGTYLENKHHRTFKHLCKPNERNLMIAFSHIDEWRDSKVTKQAIKLVKMMRLKSPKEDRLVQKWKSSQNQKINKEQSMKFIQIIRGFMKDDHEKEQRKKDQE